MAGQVIYSSKNGSLRSVVTAQGPALEFLMQRTRNTMIRTAIQFAGNDWGNVFLPQRFGFYVERHPFNYPRHAPGFFVGKARRMGLLKQVLARLTFSWDPWSSNKPPLSLVMAFKKKHPGKYTSSRTGNYTGLFMDLRADSKRRVREVVDEMESDNKFIPMVETGLTARTVPQRFRTRATATANNAKLFLIMPLSLRPAQGGRAAQTAGKGGISATVTRILRTLPTWEVTWLAKQFKTHLVGQLAGRGLSVNASGMVTSRSLPTAAGRTSTAAPRRT